MPEGCCLIFVYESCKARTVNCTLLLFRLHQRFSFQTQGKNEAACVDCELFFLVGEGVMRGMGDNEQSTHQYTLNSLTFSPTSLSQ
jgi:hypothetical protein